MVRGTFKVHLHHSVKDCEWRGPHEGHELGGSGCDERSRRLNRRMHAGCLRFEAKRDTWFREGESIGSDDSLNLFDGGLYDVGEGLQLVQGILRRASKGGGGGTVKDSKH